MKVKANLGKNRLYFTIAGQATKAELDKLYTDVRFCVADLKPGFDIISDLSACSLGHLSGIPTFRKIMNFLISNGVGEIVRVINSKSIIFNQMLNLSSRICGYQPLYVSSLEEAEQKLEHSIKRNGIRFHVNNFLVEYIANDTKGTGNIINLSTTGCAVESATLSVLAEQEVRIKIVFMQKDTPGEEFIIKARVVRAEGDMFAAEFTDLDDVRKDQLWKCLIHEAERQI